MNSDQATRPRRRELVVATHADIAVQLEERVLIDLYALSTGMTRKAIEGKIHRGEWLEGRQYHRAPDGTIWIDRKGVAKWVTTGKA